MCLDEQPLIMTLDGECSKQTSLTAQVVENSATVVIPKKLAEKRVMVHAE